MPRKTNRIAKIDYREMVAIAMFAADWEDTGVKWNNVWKPLRNKYLKMAEAALKALGKEPKP